MKGSSAISVSRMSSGSNKGNNKHKSSKSKELSRTMKGTDSKAMGVSELFSASKGQMSSLMSSGKSKNNRSRSHIVS